MEKQQVLFFRNLLLRAFVVGVVFAVLYFIITISFWDTWVSLLQKMFKLDEKDTSRAAISGFTLIRLILVFFMLVPAIALHWTSKMKRTRKA
jgi:hypothetical protein